VHQSLEDELDVDNTDNNNANSIEIASNNKSYKGFSTSMNSLFTDPEDCCMFFCYGIFLNTRKRYLFTNDFHDQENNPYQGYKYHCKSILIYYLIPIILLRIDILLCAVYVAYMMNKLVKDRVKFRLDMLDKIRSRNGVIDSEVSPSQRYQDEELSYDAHKLCCGCYPIDNDDGDYTQTQSTRRQGQYYAISTTDTDDVSCEVEDLRNEEESNFCTNIWKFISHFFCGMLFNTWCMYCGICALAQESREIKRLIPRSKLYIDFYTFQVNFINFCV